MGRLKRDTISKSLVKPHMKNMLYKTTKELIKFLK